MEIVQPHLTDTPFVQVPDSVILKQVTDRMLNPARIDQGYTNLCGMAACAMTLARFDPEGYRQLVLELTRTGKASYHKYNLKIIKTAIKLDRNYFATAKMPEADWFLLTAMRNKANLILPYGGKMCRLYEKLAGSNYPCELRRALRLMGFEREKDNMNGFWPVRKPAVQTLQSLNDYFNSGKCPIILINTRMYHKRTFSITSNHFVIFNGKLSIDEEKQSVSFNVWTFGYPNGKTISCPLEAFRNNYFGCIVVNPPATKGR